MALAPGYRQQVGPGAMPGGPRASADTMGGGIGRALADVGDALHAREITLYKVERAAKADQDAADFSAKYARLREDFDKWQVDARTNHGPGAAGHTAAAQAWIEERTKGLTDGIGENDLRNRAQGQIDDWAGRARSGEYEFEATARIGKLVSDQQSTSDIGANRARTKPGSYGEELKVGRAAIGLLNVDDDTKAKLVKYHDQKVTGGYLQGLNDTNPQLALATLRAGTFDDILTPEQREAAATGAQIAVNRLNTMAEHQASMAKTALNEEIATAKAQVAQGITGDPRQLATLADRAEAVGNTSAAVELRGLAKGQAINTETLEWKPAQYEAEIGRLRAKGSKASADEQVRLHHLETIAPGRVAEFNRDPGLWAERNGNPRPEIQWNDPGSFARLSTWQATVASATGRRPPLFSDAQRRDMATLASGNAKERLQLANQLAAMPKSMAVAAAREVSPQDGVLPWMVRYDLPATRAMVVNGAEARKLNPKLIDGTAGQDARDAWNAHVGSALQLIDPVQQAGAFEVARNMYADWSAKHGRTEWGRASEFHPDIDRALKMNIGEYAGQKVALPRGVSQDRFDSLLARLSYSDKDAPVDAAKTALTPARLRRYVPVVRPDGNYEFHGPNDSVVRARNGGIWTLDIGKLARLSP